MYTKKSDLHNATGCYNIVLWNVTKMVDEACKLAGEVDFFGM
jgi:hypothetical protein